MPSLFATGTKTFPIWESGCRKHEGGEFPHFHILGGGLLLLLKEVSAACDVYHWTKLVDCPTQLTLMTWICQLSRRWEPSKGGGKMFGASLRPGKDIWRQFLCKIYMVCPYKLVTCKQNASKKVQNLLKTAVSAGRQSHPRNEEQACSKSHMDFSGSDLHISH